MSLIDWDDEFHDARDSLVWLEAQLTHCKDVLPTLASSIHDISILLLQVDSSYELSVLSHRLHLYMEQYSYYRDTILLLQLIVNDLKDEGKV